MSARTDSAPSSAGSPVAPMEFGARIARQKRCLLWRAQKMTFWILYDFAGHFVVLNLALLSAVILPPWILVQWQPNLVWPSLALALALASAASAGQANLVAALLAGEEFSFRCVWRGALAFGPRAAALALLFASAACAAAIGVWFYTTRVTPVWPQAGPILAAVCVAGAVPLTMAGVYLLPALVHRRGSVLAALRIGFLLAARHPVLTPGLLLFSGLYGVVLASPPGLLLLSGLPLVTLSCCAYELLARGYELEAALACGGDPPENALDEHDIFLNRGFNDFLFPWKA